DANQDQNGNEDRRHLPNHPRAPFSDERYQRADQDDQPEDDPPTAQHLRYQPAERDQEEGDQHQFQDDEVAVGLHQLAIGHGRVAPSVQQQDAGGGAAETRGEEQSAQRPGIAPHWLVAHGQEHTGVGGDEQPKDRPDHHEHDAEDAAHDPAGAGEHPPAQISALTDGTQEHHEREEPEERQAPGAQGHRRIRLEHGG